MTPLKVAPGRFRSVEPSRRVLCIVERRELDARPDIRVGDAGGDAKRMLALAHAEKAAASRPSIAAFSSFTVSKRSSAGADVASR